MNEAEKTAVAELVKKLRTALSDLSGVSCDINMPESPALNRAAAAAEQAMKAADDFLGVQQDHSDHDDDPYVYALHFGEIGM